MVNGCRYFGCPPEALRHGEALRALVTHRFGVHSDSPQFLAGAQPESARFVIILLVSTIGELLESNYGVITTAQLRAAGVTRHALRKALAEAQLVKLHRGRYVCASINAAEAEPGTVARMLNGRITGFSALETHGFWVPECQEVLHIRVTPRVAEHIRESPARAQILDEANVRLHHRVLPWPEVDDENTTDSAASSMLVAEKDCRVEDLVAMGDSALRNGVQPRRLALAAKYGGHKMRTALSMLDARSGSGVESIVRVRLRSLRLRVRPQAQLGRWPVDFLIGEWLIVEVDGFAYHSGDKDFSRDRRKDRELNAAGYTVLRFTYRQVISDWEQCEREILAFVRAGRHQRPNYRPRNLDG
ncbi:MAG: type IV toxin-antitoxin system AbiEi family antitoxin domain-containing protein [Gulosibacter sp.]|uniref:type IV toxin-antitoxin system AbiEi family antitoxin domain-containing protein n=1 Tax=Gulosibacter sp. TaxID=2817531 RepID=UPI003F9307D2